jgi:hypothetical protein
VQLAIKVSDEVRGRDTAIDDAKNSTNRYNAIGDRGFLAHTSTPNKKPHPFITKAIYFQLANLPPKLPTEINNSSRLKVQGSN